MDYGKAEADYGKADVNYLTAEGNYDRAERRFDAFRMTNLAVRVRDRAESPQRSEDLER